jgi:hypothetical protein
MTKNKTKERERGREGQREGERGRERNRGRREEEKRGVGTRGQAGETNDGRNCWARQDRRCGEGVGGEQDLEGCCPRDRAAPFRLL